MMLNPHFPSNRALESRHSCRARANNDYLYNHCGHEHLLPFLNTGFAALSGGRPVCWILQLAGGKRYRPPVHRPRAGPSGPADPT